MNFSTEEYDDSTLFYLRKYIPDTSELVEEPLTDDEIVAATILLNEMKHNECLPYFISG